MLSVGIILSYSILDGKHVIPTVVLQLSVDLFMNFPTFLQLGLESVFLPSLKNYCTINSADCEYSC